MLQGVLFKKLLIGQLALQGFNMATIDFFRRTFEALLSDGGIDCPRMSQVAYVTRQNANRHARILEKGGYLERRSYRAWCINPNAITDPDFLPLIKPAVKVERVLTDPDLIFLVRTIGMVA